MTDRTFDDLPAAGALDGTETVPIEKGGATVKTTVDAVVARAPVQDHNLLTNLNVGDAHPQYLNSSRGDARYPLRTLTVTAGNGLQGGGDLSTNISFAVKPTANEGIKVTSNGVELDINGIGTLPESVDGANDRLVIYNASESRNRTVSVATALAGASGFVPTARQVVAGNGLTGGGDLSLDRTLHVGQGAGITVTADSVAIDVTDSRNVSHTAVAIINGTGITGGGDLTASRTIGLDLTNARNIDHANVSINVSNSLSGGGDLQATRTISLVGDSAAPGNNVFYGTNGSGVRGFYSVSFGILSGTATNAQIPLGAVTQYQASLSIGWGQITGTKNADQLQGNAASAFAVTSHNHDSAYVGINSNAQLNSLGVGVSASGSAGAIRATGDITAFFSSDARLKENVRPIENAVDTVLQIRGVRFDWTDDYLTRHGDIDGYFNRKEDIGVIAQEVQKVFPELVGERVDGSLAVKYDRLVAGLIECIRELNERVRILESDKL
jgi:hypothetical protein